VRVQVWRVGRGDVEFFAARVDATLAVRVAPLLPHLVVFLDGKGLADLKLPRFHFAVEEEVSARGQLPRIARLVEVEDADDHPARLALGEHCHHTGEAGRN